MPPPLHTVRPIIFKRSDNDGSQNDDSATVGGSVTWIIILSVLIAIVALLSVTQLFGLWCCLCRDDLSSLTASNNDIEFEEGIARSEEPQTLPDRPALPNVNSAAVEEPPPIITEDDRIASQRTLTRIAAEDVKRIIESRHNNHPPRNLQNLQVGTLPFESSEAEVVARESEDEPTIGEVRRSVEPMVIGSKVSGFDPKKRERECESGGSRVGSPGGDERKIEDSKLLKLNEALKLRQKGRCLRKRYEDEHVSCNVGGKDCRGDCKGAIEKEVWKGSMYAFAGKGESTETIIRVSRDLMAKERDREADMNANVERGMEKGYRNYSIPISTDGKKEDKKTPEVVDYDYESEMF